MPDTLSSPGRSVKFAVEQHGEEIHDRLARFLHAAIVALLLAALTPPAHAAPLPHESRVPGGVAIVRVADATSPAPTVTREGMRVWVTAHRAGKATPGWYAVVGIPLSAAPGEQKLVVNDKGIDRSVSFKITGKKYPTQKLTFTDKRMVEPNAEDMVRIEREGKHLTQVKRTWREARDTSAAFQLPAKGPLSSLFGLRRVLNGEARSPHAGLDVAVAAGTPIHSAAAGVVLDTGNYYFAGNMVWIDHGNALMSAYSHLRNQGPRRRARGKRPTPGPCRHDRTRDRAAPALVGAAKCGDGRAGVVFAAGVTHGRFWFT